MSYENLANAIVLQAVRDYYDMLRGKTRVMEYTLSDIERFIRSQWFGELTDLNPEYLLRLLNEDPDKLKPHTGHLR